MDVKFDFSLNERRYGVVAQAIFRLVLRGINSVPAISDLLWVFSGSVKATAIQQLVNHQILRADLQSHSLFLSDGIVSIIDACHNRTYTVDLPETMLSRIANSVLWTEDRQVNTGILRHMLPNIDMDFLAASLSFSIISVRCTHEP